MIVENASTVYYLNLFLWVAIVSAYIIHSDDVTAIDVCFKMQLQLLAHFVIVLATTYIVRVMYMYMYLNVFNSTIRKQHIFTANLLVWWNMHLLIEQLQTIP